MKVFKKILTGVLAGAMMCSLMQTVPAGFSTAAVAEAAGAVNILDYESNTSASEYAIYDVAGMEYLAELVNKGTKFIGQTITLENDLDYDKSKATNHVVIGSSDTKAFWGTFDGKNHTVSGIKINFSGNAGQEEVVGMFGYLEQTSQIKSVILKDSYISASANQSSTRYPHCVGGIAGRTSGVIQDCLVDQDVELYGNYENVFAGGVAGCAENNAEIRQCISKAELTTVNLAGGIVALLWDQASCCCCANYGNISCNWKGDSMNDMIAGGVVAEMRKKAKVSECANFGNITMDEARKYISAVNIGGICGNFNDNMDNGAVSMVNSFNAGNIQSKNAANKSFTTLSGIVGKLWLYHDLSSEVGNVYNYVKISGTGTSNANAMLGNLAYLNGVVNDITKLKIDKIQFCYQLQGNTTYKFAKMEAGAWQECSELAFPKVYEYAQSKMKSQAFVDELNANSVSLGYGEVWAKDTEGINNGYPILKNVPYDGISSSDDGGDDGFVPEDDEVPAVTPYPESAEIPDSGAVVSKLFKDYTYKTPVREDSITIYANGGKVTKSEETKDYKNYTLYTKILPSYIYTLDTKNKLKLSSGKVIVGITSSKTTKPVPDKGKIVDEEAEKVAKASIKNGQITVTAQQKPGTVYLWVMDTGDLSKSSDAAEARGTYTCCPVTVKAAPTELQLYDTVKENVTLGTTPKYTKATIDLNNTTDVYVCPVYKDGKEAKKTGDGTYSAEVESKSKDYFDVVKTGAEKFTVIAKALKDEKKTTGKIIIKNDQNGKKVNFTVTAVNRVKKVGLSGAKGVTLGSAGNISITVSKTAKSSGTVTAALALPENAVKTTDVPKIYAMKTAGGYDSTEFKKGTVKITAQPAGEQKKITASVASDKKTVTISAAKGMKTGQKTYFLFVYNTQDTAQRKGYYVFSVETK